MSNKTGLYTVLEKLDQKLYDELSDHEKGIKDILNFLFERENTTIEELLNLIK